MFKKLFYYSVMTMLLSLTLSAAPIRIMALGDSITEGISEIPQNPDKNISEYPKINGQINLTKVKDRIGYRGRLWDLLKADGYEIDYVGSRSSGSSYANYTPNFDTDHEGYGGFNTAQLLMKISSNLKSADIILLQIGTNDIGININKSIHNMKSILDKIFIINPNAKVFLAKWSDEYNSKLESMVDVHLYNESIEMVNIYSGLTNNPTGLPYDMQPFHQKDKKADYHPNKNGYLKIAHNWYDSMVNSGYLSTKKHRIPQNLWDFEESSSPYTDTIGKIKAICSAGECPSVENGQVGNGLSFDGTNKLSISSTNALNFSKKDSYTIALWMNITDDISQNHVALGGGNSTKKHLWIGAKNNKIKFEIPGGPFNQASRKEIALNTWIYIALVKDVKQKKVRLYINGRLDSEYNTEVVELKNTIDTIGSFYDSYNFRGKLDHISIYRSRLTTVEILAEYKKQSGIDNLAPLIEEVSAIKSPTNKMTPYYSFNSSKKGTIKYLGVCKSNIYNAIRGNNMITFNQLADGTYSNCKIQIIDKNSNISNILTVSPFTVDTSLETVAQHKWSLDEIASPFIDSKGSVDAVCNEDECPSQVTGQIDKAREFKGKHVLISNITRSFHASMNYSFELWMKPKGSTSKYTEVALRYGNLWIGRKDNQLRIQLPGESSHKQVSPLKINSWNHIVVVNDALNNKVYAYLNGKQINAYTSNPARLSASKLYIGSYEEVIDEFYDYNFNGSIDNVTIYDSILSKEEIKKNYVDKEITFPTSATIKVDMHILQGSDDAYENRYKRVYTKRSDNNQYIMIDRSAPYVGLRFQNLNIPQNSVITNAYITMTSRWNNNGGKYNPAYNIYAEASDNANTFKSRLKNISNREKTQNRVFFKTPDVNRSGESYNTPELKSLVQEVVNRRGWRSGNNLAFIFHYNSGKKWRAIQSYEKDISKSAKLYIEYNVSAKDVPRKSVSKKRTVITSKRQTPKDYDCLVLTLNSAPAFSGEYIKDGKTDGTDRYKRKNITDGNQYYLYRNTWDWEGKTYRAWFVSIQTSLYPWPANKRLFFYTYIDTTDETLPLYLEGYEVTMGSSERIVITICDANQE
ncbi:MAG: GDSL-type esterase/lipase family protein [Sulfurovum sp.]|nr:GDSL-type esterase/lipase family protein [Sulfurovum sp.]